MNPKKLLNAFIAIVACAAPYHAQANTSCEEHKDLKARGLDYLQVVSKTIESASLAEPLHAFLRNLDAGQKKVLAHVYELDVAPEGLISVINPAMDAAKKSFDRIECAQGDRQQDNVPIPQCVTAKGKVYPAAAYSVFLSQTTIGLHPHLYASSCLREGAKSNCLTIDLLSYIDGKQQIETLIKQKSQEVRDNQVASCVPAAKKSESLGSKIINTLKTIVSATKSVIASGLLPAL
ncbi:MAG: hypothetical protein HY074_16385 [Deltaproteobacteria bacterium]|nr:hypothetical protein [Deltaproteobacteria bacterium]